MRVRRNVKHLTTDEKNRFVNAVLALKSQPSVLHPGDSTRSRYDDYPEVHFNAMMANPGCAHRRVFQSAALLAKKKAAHEIQKLASSLVSKDAQRFQRAGARKTR
jgi:hypothetical protein